MVQGGAPFQRTPSPLGGEGWGEGERMARFSITVDDRLMEDVTKLADGKTKRQAIEQALREFVERRRIAQLMELRGSDILEWTPEDFLRYRKMGIPESWSSE